MRSLLIDTTLLIDGERLGGSLDDLIADTDEVAIAAVTVAELMAGLHLATAPYRERRQRFIEGILATVDVIPYDREVASAHASLLAFAREQGRPRGAHDLIIAATAQATRRTVATLDERGFADLPGVEVILAR